MKISYRTHPILEKLNNRKLGKVAVPPKDYDVLLNMRSILKRDFENFVDNPFSCFYLTEPFVEAVNMAFPKLKDSKLWIDVPSGNYCFLFKSGSYCARIVNDLSLGALEYESCEFANSNDGPIILEFGKATLFYDDLKNDGGNIRSAGFSGFKSSMTDIEPMQNMICYAITALFIKYAEIETTLLPPKKAVEKIRCKYKNESNSQITILDSKWITTLVKSDSFKVRAHFRLQPKKKDGEWTKELIWINDFVKDGYTAPARKIAAGFDESLNYSPPADH